MHIRFVAILITATLLTTQALALNTPCSGRKGGVARCQGKLFVCKDGSISQSKLSCSADEQFKGPAGKGK